MFTKNIALLSFLNNDLEGVWKKVYNDLEDFIYNMNNDLKKLKEEYGEIYGYGELMNLVDVVLATTNKDTFLEELEYHVINDEESMNAVSSKFSNLIEIINFKNGNGDISDEKIIKEMINKVMSEIVIIS